MLGSNGIVNITHPEGSDVKGPHVVFDFDGSCTRVQDAAPAFLAEFRRLFTRCVGPGVAAGWDAALAVVRARSPEAGWMLGGTASAPAAADPYILAGETAGYVVRTHGIQSPLPTDLHARAYEAAPAPFRHDLLEVLDGLARRGCTMSFVSNSSTRSIEARLDEYLAQHPALRRQIEVVGDAGKFKIRELSSGSSLHPDLRRAFESLPETARSVGLDRPVYLRRGAYFEALCKVWRNTASAIGSTVVCGDIWELDLAMPAALGMCTHLITRASPYDTYAYELHAAQRAGTSAGVSDDLRGLLTTVEGTLS